MLWKPYKRKGLSGCFQPKWDGPWSIVKFTGNGKTNCKIVKCNEPSKKLNVHVNQLKPAKTRHEMNASETDIAEKQAFSETTTTSQFNASEQFLDYLDDFEEDDRVRNVEVQNVEDDGIQNVEHPVNVNDNEIVEHNAQALHPDRPMQRIDQHWVTVDESNIIQGSRTRGHRPNYQYLAAGDD